MKRVSDPFDHAAAFNDAARRIDETQKEKMASVSAGMQLPPGFKMPF